MADTDKANDIEAVGDSNEVLSQDVARLERKDVVYCQGKRRSNPGAYFALVQGTN